MTSTRRIFVQQRRTALVATAMTIAAVGVLCGAGGLAAGADSSVSTVYFTQGYFVENKTEEALVFNSLSQRKPEESRCELALPGLCHANGFGIAELSTIIEPGATGYFEIPGSLYTGTTDDASTITYLTQSGKKVDLWAAVSFDWFGGIPYFNYDYSSCRPTKPEHLPCDVTKKSTGRGAGNQTVFTVPAP